MVAWVTFQRMVLCHCILYPSDRQKNLMDIDKCTVVKRPQSNAGFRDLGRTSIKEIDEISVIWL